MIAPDTLAALIRSIIVVAAVGGNIDRPTASPEFGVFRIFTSIQNGTKLSIVRMPDICAASRRLLVIAPMPIMRLA